jgi:hypothetical protein
MPYYRKRLQPISIRDESHKYESTELGMMIPKLFEPEAATEVPEVDLLVRPDILS